MTDPLTAAANAISTSSPKVRQFAQLAAQRIEALEAKVAAMQPPSIKPRLALVKEGSSLAGFTNLDKYAIVIVSADGVADAKSKCPTAKKLLYANASQVVTAYTEGLSYTTAKANGWLVAEVPPAGSGHWVVNHSIAALNDAQAKAIVQYITANGMDGCFLDDTIPINPYGVTTPAGYRDGMVAFVHELRDLLAAQGGYLLTNANAFTDPSLGNGDDGTGDLAWAKMLLPHGIMSESWQQTRDGKNAKRLRGPNWYQHWDEWQKVPAGVQAAGMDFVGLSYGQNVYGGASLLLQDQGRCFFAPAKTDGTDAWSADLATYVSGSARPVVDPVAGTASL